MEQQGPGDSSESFDEEQLASIPICHQPAAAKQPDKKSPLGGGESVCFMSHAAADSSGSANCPIFSRIPSLQEQCQCRYIIFMQVSLPQSSTSWSVVKEAEISLEETWGEGELVFILKDIIQKYILSRNRDPAFSIHKAVLKIIILFLSKCIY